MEPESAQSSVRGPGLVYGLEDRVPLGTSLLVGSQHVLAMMVGTVTPPLLLAQPLKFSPEQTAYLVSMALLSSALGTFLQCRRPGPIGSGLLSVTGTSFAFMGVLAQAHAAGGFALMLGMSCLLAPLQVLLAPLLRHLRSVFTPLVSGTIVLLIGTSLIPTAFFSLAQPVGASGSPLAGLGIALAVVATIVGTQATGRLWARVGGIAAGVGVGVGACALLGGLVPPPAGDGAWLTVPRPLAHGLAFGWSLVLPFAFIYLVSLVEAVGDMTATAQLSGLRTDDAAHGRRLAGGVAADGLTSTVAALFGGFPSATYAQNNGVIQLTGVASRRVGYVMAVLLAILGLFPVVGRYIAVVPAPVIGALAMLLFGLVAVSGLRLILGGGLGQREAVVVALSLAIGLGLPTQPGLVAAMPALVRPIFESGIAAGGLTALVLNALWRPDPVLGRAASG